MSKRTYLVYFVRAGSDDLAGLRRSVRALVASVDAQINCDLLVAIDEVVTNSILHGAPGGVVKVHVALDDRKVTATVADSGSGFDLVELMSSWPPGSDQEQGRGIYLLTRLMDSVSIEAGLGTIVHMTRALHSDTDRGAPICLGVSRTHAHFSHDGSATAQPRRVGHRGRREASDRPPLSAR
jgi:anti-sigma regulatory factor (Ser/Thr protein kinase)